MNIYTEIFTNLDFVDVILQYIIFLVFFIGVMFIPPVLTTILSKFQKFANYSKKIEEKLEKFNNGYAKLTNYSIFKGIFLPPLLIQIIFYLLLIFFENPLICSYLKIQIEGFSINECRDYFEYLENLN